MNPFDVAPCSDRTRAHLAFLHMPGFYAHVSRYRKQQEHLICQAPRLRLLTVHLQPGVQPDMGARPELSMASVENDVPGLLAAFLIS